MNLSDKLTGLVEDKALLLELKKYLICSCLALGLDLAIYSLSLLISSNYFIAACLGFSAGLLCNYFLSKEWAFTDRAIQDSRIEFIIFSFIGLVGLGLTEYILFLGVQIFKLHPMAVKLMAVGIVFLFNFTARKIILFSPSLKKQNAA